MTKLYIKLLIIFLLLFSCTPRMIIPKNTKIEYNYKTNIIKPFGYYSKKQNKIIINNPVGEKSITKNKINELISNHELGHLYGIKHCKNLRCIMFESKSRLIEMLVKPYQLLYGFTFCKKCKSYLKEKKAFK